VPPFLWIQRVSLGYHQSSAIFSSIWIAIGCCFVISHKSSLAYFPILKKYSRRMRSRCCVCARACIPPIIARQPLSIIPLSLLGNGLIKSPYPC
jgi:hypothetical protein